MTIATKEYTPQADHWFDRKLLYHKNEVKWKSRGFWVSCGVKKKSNKNSIFIKKNVIFD